MSLACEGENETNEKNTGQQGKKSQKKKFRRKGKGELTGKEFTQNSTFPTRPFFPGKGNHGE